MPDALYQRLSADDRRYALRVAQDKGRHRAFLLEKDIRVVATLAVLFDAPFAAHLTFKGGTSLSKVWRAIRRFSEDIDITYDIRSFAPDLVSSSDDEALPPTRSQEKRWTRAIRARLSEWVRDRACTTVQEGLAHGGFAAQVRAETDRLRIGYEPLFEETGFVRPEVMVEFGARSTGEPHSVMPVACDAAVHLPDLVFPQARPIVMLAERTFWEKATAIHVYCRQERRRGERLSRHWHDLARLNKEEEKVRYQALVDELNTRPRDKAAEDAKRVAYQQAKDNRIAAGRQLREPDPATSARYTRAKEAAEATIRRALETANRVFRETKEAADAELRQARDTAELAYQQARTRSLEVATPIYETAQERGIEAYVSAYANPKPGLYRDVAGYDQSLVFKMALAERKLCPE